MSETISLPINIPQTELSKFCQRHLITKLSLFGSVLRNDFTPESDLDFLVEFKPNYIPTFFKLAQMERELSTLFKGRKIDLRTPQELSPYFREKVIQEAVIQYDITR
jgi:hypothetical protein